MKMAEKEGFEPSIRYRNYNYERLPLHF